MTCIRCSRALLCLTMLMVFGSADAASITEPLTDLTATDHESSFKQSLLGFFLACCAMIALSIPALYVLISFTLTVAKLLRFLCACLGFCVHTLKRFICYMCCWPTIAPIVCWLVCSLRWRLLVSCLDLLSHVFLAFAAS